MKLSKRFFCSACFILVAASKVMASEIELGEILVSSKRAAISSANVSEDVTIVDSGDIEMMPVENLSDTLRYVPGVDVDERSVGKATSVSIRGADSRQVRVMIDGIPLNTQASGQANPAKFPVENVERIEVINGPSSSMWGSSLGGVINVITKDTGNTVVPKGKVSSSFSGFGGNKESMELAGKAANLGYYVFSSYMTSAGRGDHDDVLEQKGFGKFSYDLGDSGRLFSSFGYSEAEVNSGRFPDDSWQSQPYRVKFGKFGWNGEVGSSDTTVEFKNSRQNTTTKSYDMISDDVPSSVTTYEDILYELSLNSAFHPRGKDLFVIGGDFDLMKLKSSYLKEAKTGRTQAPYLNYTLSLEPWDLSSGLRYDHNDIFGSQVSPSWGAVYHLPGSSGILLRGAVSRAFNAPPLLWKYYENQFGTTVNNPDIKPERAWVYELGVENRTSAPLWFKLSVYRSDVTDAIARAVNSDNKRYMKNYNKFRRQGVGLESRLKLLKGLSLLSAAGFNDVEDRSTKATVRDGGRVRQSYDAGFEYKSDLGFSALLKGYYRRWDGPAENEPNDRKMLMDIKLMQDLKHCELFFSVHNVLNSKYWADYYFPNRQRYFEGGFSVKW